MLKNATEFKQCRNLSNVGTTESCQWTSDRDYGVVVRLVEEIIAPAKNQFGSRSMRNMN